MSYSPLYLPSSVPQWGIFLGVVFVIIGYVEKSERWNTTGWMILIVTGLFSLFFNLFGGLMPDENISETALNILKASGWLSSAGAFLAAITLYFRYLKSRSYKVLAVLTIIFFILIFFQFNYITRSQKMADKVQQKEQIR